MEEGCLILGRGSQQATPAGRGAPRYTAHGTCGILASKTFGDYPFLHEASKNARCTRAQKHEKNLQIFYKKNAFFFQEKNIFFSFRGGYPPKKGQNSPKGAFFDAQKKSCDHFCRVKFRPILAIFGLFWGYIIYIAFTFLCQKLVNLCVCVCVSNFTNTNATAQIKRRFVLERNIQEVRNVTFQPGNIRAQKKEPAREKGAITNTIVE